MQALQASPNHARAQRPQALQAWAQGPQALQGAQGPQEWAQGPQALQNMQGHRGRKHVKLIGHTINASFIDEI